MGFDFHKWPSIESFRSVAHNSSGRGEVFYRSKIKMHGTNAAIIFGPEGVAAQSRTRIITPDDDNCGFAAWLSNASLSVAQVEFTLFGEWCGQGIQRGVAVSRIDRKVFAAYAVKVGDAFITEPDIVKSYAPNHPDIFVLPWNGSLFPINFLAVSADTLATINAEIADVEKEDPWVLSTFGVAGTGEGCVYYPVTEAGTGIALSVLNESPEYLGRRVFKAKGEAHRVNGHAEAVSLKMAMVEGVPAFASFAVTEARLRQGLFEVCQDSPAIQKTGDFLKWVQGDIRKECAEELSVFPDEGKALGVCGKVIVQWFKHQCNGGVSA
jgi:hypothetical protein